MSMRIFIAIFVFVLCAALCKDFNHMYMRSKFPKHVFLPTDTLHFGPDHFNTSDWNSKEITDLDKFLQNGNSCTGSVAAENGYFFKPLMKIDFGGADTGYIVAEGDTTDVWIYEGKNTFIYMYDDDHLLKQKYQLAWGGAGEGPWYETDSWILDLNTDHKPDILTRETGEWLLPDSTGEFVFNSQDDLTAVTWNDTGFVKIEVRNEDSLKRIYKTHFRHK